MKFLEMRINGVGVLFLLLMLVSILVFAPSAKATTIKFNPVDTNQEMLFSFMMDGKAYPFEIANQKGYVLSPKANEIPLRDGEVAYSIIKNGHIWMITNFGVQKYILSEDIFVPYAEKSFVIKAFVNNIFVAMCNGKMYGIIMPSSNGALWSIVTCDMSQIKKGEPKHVTEERGKLLFHFSDETDYLASGEKDVVVFDYATATFYTEQHFFTVAGEFKLRDTCLILPNGEKMDVARFGNLLGFERFTKENQSGFRLFAMFKHAVFEEEDGNLIPRLIFDTIMQKLCSAEICIYPLSENDFFCGVMNFFNNQYSIAPYDYGDLPPVQAISKYRGKINLHHDELTITCYNLQTHEFEIRTPEMVNDDIL
jgi:hypothetical protein